jgi:DNA-binding transcriptional regulator GbsR (MarR family)
VIKEKLMELEEADNADSGDSTPPLIGGNSELSQFVENMGLHYEDYGLARIAGRIIGLLLVSPRPISSEEMAEALQVSRSSISTNLRTLLLAELIEKVSLPGERVDYYSISPETWQKGLELRLASILPLKEFAQEGLECLAEDHPGRQRLFEMMAWVDMVEEVIKDLNLKWQSYLEAPASPG